MNKKTIKLFKKLTLLLIIGLLLWSVGAKYVSLHEDIHHRIFIRYDIDSNVSINYLKLEGITTPTSYKDCNDFCKLSHTLNDVAFYSLNIFIHFLVILTLIILIFRKNE